MNGAAPHGDFFVLEGVSKRFGALQVLDGLSLRVRAGETLVVLGGSGTGKSVMLRHLVGITVPDAGRVEVDGTAIEALGEDALVAVRRKVGFLFQGGALFDSLDVADNIAFPLREAGWDAARVAARVAEVLALVDLPPRSAREMPDALSGGMRKRAALARAMAVGPRAMLYDEPTTGLDPVTSDTINDLIRALQQRLAITSVVVTHDIASAFRVADRIAFLASGRIGWLGTPDEARRSELPELADFVRPRT